MPATLEATGLRANPLPDEPAWLRSDVRGRPIGVDREAGVIRGVILAEEGTFKDERGVFDRAAIRRVVKLGNESPNGLKSRFAHPTLSSDGLGKFTGRVKGIRSDTILRERGKDADGKPLLKEVLIARGDQYFDKTALEEPPGGGKPLGVYLMDLAESDPDAMGMSLVLKADQNQQLDSRGRILKDEAGKELPPLWMPTELHAVDSVDTGDATNSFLSADLLASLPDAALRQGVALLDQQFCGQSKEATRARLTAFVDRYLAYRFGDGEAEGFGAEQSAEPELSVAQADVPDEIEGTVDEGLALDLWLATEGE